MRCNRPCVWGCLLLSMLIVGCGAGPEGKMMSAPEGDVTTFEAVGSAIATTPEEPFTPELTFDEPPMMIGDGEPGGGDELMSSPEPLDNIPELTTSIDVVPPESVPASTANNWPMITHQATVPVRPTQPAEIPPRPARTSVDHVDEIVRNLDYGTVVYNAPTEMAFGEPRLIEIVLSPTHTVNELTDVMRSPTDVQSASLQVGNRMEAKLVGSGFDIEPLSEPLQAITSTRPTVWRFNVTPVEHGPQELHLYLLAHIDVAGKDTPMEVETKYALIEVNITVAQRVAGFVSTNWQWLWAAVVVPAIGFAWRRKTGRDRSHRSDPPQPHYRTGAGVRSRSASV